MRLIDADNFKLGLCKECTLYPNKCLKENCDWEIIYHLKIEKTVEAIPIEFIEKWTKDEDTDFEMLRNTIVELLIYDWRKENGNY